MTDTPDRVWVAVDSEGCVLGADIDGDELQRRLDDAGADATLYVYRVERWTRRMLRRADKMAKKFAAKIKVE